MAAKDLTQLTPSECWDSPDQVVAEFRQLLRLTG
jgi:hypothetical protein